MDKTGRWKHRKVDSTETGLQLCAVYLQQCLTEAFFWLSVTRSVWTVWCRQRGSPGQIYSPNHFQSLHIPVQAAKNAWDIFSIKLFNLTEINLRSILQEKLFFFKWPFFPQPSVFRPKQSLWHHLWTLTLIQTYTPVQMQWNTSQMILSMLSFRLGSAEDEKGSTIPVPKNEQCSTRKGVCLWAMTYWTLQASRILPCSAVQIDTCSNSLHTSLASHQLWRRFKWQISDRHAAGGVQSCLYVDVMRFLWEISYVWVGVFGEHLAGNADSSQQNENRRVSVIVSLRENMNVCQKHCKKWWRFPVVLQMVFPSSLPITLIAFSLAGLQLPVCFTIGLQCTRLPVPPSRYPLFYREHTLCGCERQLG